MKKLYFFTLFILTSVLSFGQDLIITGVFDGPLPGGTPKGIELYVLNDITDLSAYGLEKAGNGAASTGAQTYTFPADAYTAGSYIYVVTEAPYFNQYFGLTATYINSNEVNHNGDDTIILYYNNAVSDLFGVIGVDGTGEVWECLDGWAHRNNTATGPNATFTPSEWNFSGPNATDGCDLADDTGTNSGCSSVEPIASYPSLLSVKRTLIEGFKLYPNPTSSNYVNIFGSKNDKMDVTVFDVLGKEIYRQTVNNNKLNVSNLKAGVYVLRASQGNASITRKLVVK